MSHSPGGRLRNEPVIEIQHLDFLKIDIQGGELAVFRGGKAKLAQSVAIQTEVSFVTRTRISRAWETSI